jgi:hypothetical protein
LHEKLFCQKSQKTIFNILQTVCSYLQYFKMELSKFYPALAPFTLFLNTNQEGRKGGRKEGVGAPHSEVSATQSVFNTAAPMPIGPRAT